MLEIVLYYYRQCTPLRTPHTSRRPPRGVVLRVVRVSHERDRPGARRVRDARSAPTAVGVCRRARESGDETGEARSARDSVSSEFESQVPVTVLLFPSRPVSGQRCQGPLCLLCSVCENLSL